MYVLGGAVDEVGGGIGSARRAGGFAGGGEVGGGSHAGDIRAVDIWVRHHRG